MNLEKKFNTATMLLESLDDIDEDLNDMVCEAQTIPVDVESCQELSPVTENLPAVPGDEFCFNMSQLKQDFLMVRNNTIALIAKGQRILDQMGTLELADLKASQVEALSCLQTVVGNNLRLIMDTYKQVAEIEKLRQKQMQTSGQMGDTGSNINNGTVNNIVFQGTPDDLLNLINNNK